MSTAMREAAYKSGLMDAEYHERLVIDMQSVVQQAGIPEYHVWTPMRKHCGEHEVAYVTDIKKHTDREDPVFGMVYIGNISGSPVNDRMMSIAGACLRQYINAKVMTLQEVLDAQKDHTMPSTTVLLISNFYFSRKGGGHIADWEVSSLLGLLYKRQQEGRQTIVYVSDWDGLKTDYGQVFADHLGGNKFVKITHKLTEENTN